MAPLLFDISQETLNDRMELEGITAYMYADDVVVIGGDLEVVRAIQVIEEWSNDNNMTINKSKCGILPVTISRFTTERDVNGYPVVESYKYLGLVMNGRLDLKEHCKLINKKAAFISSRLYGLRLKDDLRTNMNLFKVFIMPSYRMAFTLYDRQNEQDKAALERHMRVWAKKFIRIPINTAGHTFDLIAGDLRGTVEQSIRRTRKKLTERLAERVVEGPEPEPPEKGLKYLPRNLSPMLRAIYGSRCR